MPACTGGIAIGGTGAPAPAGTAFAYIPGCEGGVLIPGGVPGDDGAPAPSGAREPPRPGCDDGTLVPGGGAVLPACEVGAPIPDIPGCEGGLLMPGWEGGALIPGGVFPLACVKGTPRPGCEGGAAIPGREGGDPGLGREGRLNIPPGRESGPWATGLAEDDAEEFASCSGCLC